MSQFSDITETLMVILKSPYIAAAADVDATVWNDLRVFYSSGPFIKGMNRGRIPFIHLYRADTAFSWETEPEHGGVNTFRFKLDIHTGFGDALDSESKAYFILEESIKRIRGNVHCTSGQHEVQEIEDSPFGFALRLNFTVQLIFQARD